ncbi:MAG TPA: MFS transporter [Stellaceae bacterium]|jgi:MFS family permease
MSAARTIETDHRHPGTSQESGLFAWLVVGICFLALALAFSARSALGLAMPLWEQELGWSRGFTSTGGAIALVCMACVAPFAGNLVDRHGPRRLILTGLAVIAVGMLAVASMHQRWIFLVAYSGLAAVGFGIIAMHVIATAVAGFFERNRGLATGIATSGATAGQLLVVPLLAVLLENGSWRLSFLSLGIGALVLIPAVLLALRRRTPAAAAAHGPAKAAAAEPLSERLAFLARNPVFHALFWSFLLCGFTTAGVIETHFLPYAALCGFTPIVGASAFGVLSAFNFCGIILAGWLADRVHRPALLGGIYIVRAVVFVLLLKVGASAELLFLFAILFGISDYATVPVTASLAASHLGLRIMGLAMGLIGGGHALGAAVGSYLGGYFFDLFARYDNLWLVSIGLTGVAGLIAFMVREIRGSSSEPSPVPAE